ncbi:S-layer homology domain-containing protein [Ructibacterium gallinarum]|uniref:S-layer homology domain-containing protein n=1 Tax=Ructibacterium gallinarum TaxID=2779355 RepID=A0A9D5LZJ5_9FIRM|nr:S-layer homology domain-containing protein [Ructibacterium gallinarum]MBE5040951.1 S-layer homology domain-containing protein [Ructibacterium gallinarum]
MLKKGIHLLLAFLLCITGLSSVNVFAAEEVSESIIVEMQAFDIVRGDEEGNLNLDDAVSRAEFSAMMVRMLKMEEWYYTDYAFTDVSTADWFYEDVMRLTTVGIIAGFEDGTFRPNHSITTAEAAKMIVVALGYGGEAEASGGYPSGYVAMASKLGVLYGADIASEALTRADVIIMLYNSMDISLLEPEFIGSDNLMVSGTTIRDLHLYQGSNGIFAKKKGYVTATPEIWLITPYPDLQPNEVVIDGVVMDANGYDVTSYLGMEVTYYVSGDNELGPYTLQGISPTDKNTVYEFDEETYVGRSGNNLTVYEENRTRNYRMDDFCILVRNLRPIMAPTDKDFTLSRGNVRMIDNNGDHAIDYVFIEEFESVLIERVSEDEIWLDATTPYHDLVYFDVLKNSDITYFIEDAEGNALNPEELTAGSVLSIISDGSNVYKMILGQEETITGMITSLNGEDGKEFIAIDGTEYDLEPGSDFDITVGIEVTCALNFRGEVASIKQAENTYSYGYALATAQDGFSYKVKMLCPGPFKAEVKIEDEDEDDAVETQILKGSNSDVVTLFLAEKVRVNGEKIEDSEAANIMSQNGIVKYRLNSDNQISVVDTPELVGTDIMGSAQKRKYNGYEQIFGGIGAGAFAVTEETSVLCIPDYEGVTSDKDYLATVEILDGSTYVVNGYDMDAEDEVAKLIVIEVPLRYSTAGDLEEDAPAVLENVITQLDEEGNEIKVLVYWQDGEQKTTEVDSDCDVSDLQAGDVFLAALGATSENILQIQKIVSLVGIEPGSVSLGSGSSSLLGGTINTGYPMKIAYNKIDDANNRRVDVVTLGLDNNCLQQRNININVRNAPDVYIYDAKRNVVSVGDTSMIPPCGTNTADADMVMVYEKDLKVQLVVIVTQ